MSDTFTNIKCQIWTNTTIGIQFGMDMLTGSRFTILNDKLTPTFHTSSMKDLEKLYSDV